MVPSTTLFLVGIACIAMIPLSFYYGIDGYMKDAKMVETECQVINTYVQTDIIRTEINVPYVVVQWEYDNNLCSGKFSLVQENTIEKAQDKLDGRYPIDSTINAYTYRCDQVYKEGGISGGTIFLLFLGSFLTVSMASIIIIMYREYKRPLSGYSEIGILNP